MVICAKCGIEVNYSVNCFGEDVCRSPYPCSKRQYARWEKDDSLGDKHGN